MLTGKLAARNVALGERNDVWAINTDQEYLEEVGDEADPKALEAAVDDALIRVFARLDRTAFGLALGSVCGLALSIVTLAAASSGRTELIAFLNLLGQYFPGYRVGPAAACSGSSTDSRRDSPEAGWPPSAGTSRWPCTWPLSTAASRRCSCGACSKDSEAARRTESRTYQWSSKRGCSG
jgi:hypothetical protein